MKPPPIRYERAASAAEAISYLAEHGDETKVLAGGQSLVALLNLRLARPEVVLDIGRAEDLGGWHREGDELVIGALTTQREIELDPRVAEWCPLLAAAVPHVAHIAIRNRGTIGGTIAHGDSSAELPIVLAALGGSVTVRSATSERRVAAADFFHGFLMTAAQPDELVTEVRFPLSGQGSGSAFLEFARRPGDFALVSVACSIEQPAEAGRRPVRLALGGVSSVPVVVAGELTDADAADVAELLAERVDAAIDPVGDIHGSAEYRRHLARRLTALAIESSLDQGAE
jgi:CO/xanthine dehydrogenase FAD-binding subunit